MRSLPFLLCLFVWCQAADNIKDQLTDLGQNVTINCNLNASEVYWILLKRSDPPVLILRSFSNLTPFYFSTMFSHKYLIKTKHHLFINNVTIDELGVYFCMGISGDPVFDSTRLKSTEATALTDCWNHTVAEFIPHNHTAKYIQQNQTLWLTFTIISGLLNAALVVVVIGLLKPCAFRKKRSDNNSQQHHNTDLEPTQRIQRRPGQLQHFEEDTSMLYTNTCPRPVNSTYTLLST